MQTHEARLKRCPTGERGTVEPWSKPRMRFCVADQCMAWQWHPGHEEAQEQTEVWYGDNLYPLPSVPSSDADDDLAEMLRNCHAQIRQLIVQHWQPDPPEGDGWVLREKSWEANTLKPRAVFIRQRPERQGYCGFIPMVASWEPLP